jgi:PAS domain S-box-containing protein
MDHSNSTPFRLIAEYTYDWETWVDASGVARWINPAVERITGYGVQECLSLADYPLALAFDDDKPVLERVLDEARAGGSGNDVEFRVRRKDGDLRWVAISWQVARGDFGELIGYRTSVRDIEERKRVEAELHVMRRRAEAAAVARTELLANVSHELRSPVHCIAGFADLLLDSSLDRVQRRYLELIANECAGMLRQVEDLLQLAAMEAGGLRIDERAFDLGELVESVVEAGRPGAAARQLTLQSELSVARPWLLGDPTRIAQVLRNLLDNALKFTEHGGVRVLARGVPEAERIRLELAVEDTGSGIDPDEIERLMQPFQQANSASTRRHAGVGLGLSIVQRLVSAMHGTLAIDSALHNGTTVRVTLWLAPGAPTQRALEPTPARAIKSIHRGEAALVVDDSAPARELLRAMLERSGYRVEEAESSQVAVARFERDEFDLVLLDYQMPDADGTETAQALRRVRAARPSARKTFIYLLTANVFARERVGTHPAIDGILEKPLSRAALDTLLSEMSGESVVAQVKVPPAVIDPRVIEDLSELKTQTGEPMLPRLLAQTEAAQARDFALLDAALAELDQPSIARLAHNVAGQAALVGAHEVTRRARELEDEAAAGELTREDADGELHELKRAWTRAVRALNQLLTSNE